MYRRSAPGQLTFENFYLPFGGTLSGNNRWVKLAELIPWEECESEYAQQFSEKEGAPAKSFRMALGALIIKEKLGISDAETVEQIRENPYLQYFLGLSEYSDTAPFDASMMTHFRQRLSLEWVGQINASIVLELNQQQEASQKIEAQDSQQDRQDNNNDEPPSESPFNQGQLILDATCAPADIRYPTDLGLLNEARENSEVILDALYQQIRTQLPKKPRTYRRTARKRYLAIAKKRKPRQRLIRKGVRAQLGYLRRNLAHIDTLVEASASLAKLSAHQYRLLLVITEVFRQQQQMYQTKTRRIDDRIVSLTQPHVRPIVRGKAGVPVEFGAKLSVSCVEGYVFLDHLSWDNFNESSDLKGQVESFRVRFGHYPKSVHADQIYRCRDNLRWCKQRGIRLSGPPLGRPIEDAAVQADLKRQARDDEKVRVLIEGKFGQAKRRFGLARVMAKLASTAQTAIAMTFLVMNLERGLRAFLLFFFDPYLTCLSALRVLLNALEAAIIKDSAQFNSLTCEGVGLIATI